MKHNYKEKYCKINDVEINFLDEGNGFPIILIHGFPQNKYLWRNIIPKLIYNYRVIAPDLRGMGRSSQCHVGQDKKTLASDIIK